MKLLKGNRDYSFSFKFRFLLGKALVSIEIKANSSGICYNK